MALESYGYPGDEFISIEEPTAKLAGKTLALSFKPATKADEDIIAAQLPAPEADRSIDPNKLPKTLPGYLINLNAELTINGETIKAGTAGKMGGELYEEMALWSPKEGCPEQAARLKQQLEATKTKLESNNDVQLVTLTKHNLVGDLLYGTVFNYFALNDLQDQIAAQSSDIINYRLPSYGTFSTNLQIQYWYGLPRNVTFGSLSMDIDHMKQHRNSKTNNKEETIAFSQSIGARMSAMEHLVPEQMFSTETEKAQGISAVKALAIASQQGQKIWTITNDNVDLALNRINLGAEAENDIRNAVNAGKIATAHETRINFNGWVGEGYTLIDPSTGAGAYMISGGGNGGLLKKLGDAFTKYFLLGTLFKELNVKSIILKFFTTGFLQVIGVFVDAYKLFTGCSSMVNALILTLVFALIAVAIAIALFFIPIVYGLYAFFLSLVLGYLQSRMVDEIIEVGC